MDKGRYRVVTTKTGKKVRLHFVGKKVDEAKNLKTGEMRTKEEFMQEEEMKRRHKKVRMPLVGHG